MKARKIITKTQAIEYLTSYLSEARREGATIYLLCFGNFSKTEYERLAEKNESRVIDTRSIFKNWLKFISFLVPQSVLGILEVSDNEQWPASILELSESAYVMLVASLDAELISVIRRAALDSSKPDSVANSIIQKIPGAKLVLIYSEEFHSVEIDEWTMMLPEIGE